MAARAMMTMQANRMAHCVPLVVDAPQPLRQHRVCARCPASDPAAWLPRPPSRVRLHHPPPCPHRILTPQLLLPLLLPQPVCLI